MLNLEQFSELIKDTVNDDCTVDLSVLKDNDLSYIEVPNFDSEGNVSSEYEFLAIIKLSDGIFAFEFNKPWDINDTVVGVSVDCVDDIVFEIDLEGYIGYLDLLKSNITNLFKLI